MPSIATLLDVHEEIAVALEHACLEPKGPGLDTLGKLLRWHIKGENELLIPRYAALETEIPRLGSPEVLVEEHRKIIQLLERAEQEPDPLAQLKILRRLAHLLEHHDEREEQTFKRALDRLLDPWERRGLLEQIAGDRPPLPTLESLRPDPAVRPLVEQECRRVLDQASAARARLSEGQFTAAAGYSRKLSALSARMVAHLSAGAILEALDSSLSLGNLLAALQRG